MAVHVRFLTDDATIELRYEGHVTAADLRAGALDALQLARQHHSLRCLTDCRPMTGGHSITDLYELIAMLEQQDLGTGFREALLFPALPNLQELASFYETACFNRGINVRIFTDREASLAWLRAP